MSKYIFCSKAPEMESLYKQSICNRWQDEEININGDLRDIVKLSNEELDYFRFIFSFLSSADDLVNINLGQLSLLFDQKDILHYYIEQESIEAVHSRTYAKILSVLFYNNDEHRDCYVNTLVNTEAVIQKKINWLECKVSECNSVPMKYILMILIEGIFFVSSFASISYLRARQICQGICQSNTLISRDEALHTLASCIMYNRYLKKYEKPPACEIYRVFKEAVEIELEFLDTKSRGVSHLVNVSAIKEFIKYSADRLLIAIKLQPLYNAPEPKADFPLRLTTIQKSINFFECRSTDYCAAVINDL